MVLAEGIEPSYVESQATTLPIGYASIAYSPKNIVNITNITNNIGIALLSFSTQRGSLCISGASFI